MMKGIDLKHIIFEPSKIKLPNIPQINIKDIQIYKTKKKRKYKPKPPKIKSIIEISDSFTIEI
jgi:hypothetical protein